MLNLFPPDHWVETFCLTSLEEMAFGIPVIALPVGGPLEVVSDGQIDPRQGDVLALKVGLMAGDEALCLGLSVAARQKADQFSPHAFAQGASGILDIPPREKLGA